MAAITISGTVGGDPFYYELRPSSIDTSIKNIGDDIQAIDGTTNRFHRAYKIEVSLTFDKVREATADQLETIFTATTEFVYTDIRGITYNVYTTKDSFSKNLAASNVSLQGVRLYDVKIGFTEI